MNFVSRNVILSTAKDLVPLTMRVPTPKILRCAQDDMAQTVT
jgi:hypothetical protein